jgi:putative SOS response-associated peptidase YedK
MPVILPPEDYGPWLDPAEGDVHVLQALLRPYAAEAMEAYPVGRWVNRPENDGEQCVAPLADSWYKQAQQR